MEKDLIQILKEGSVDKFKSALQKATKESAEKLLEIHQNGMNLLHICCSQGYTAHVQVLLNIAEKHLILKEYLNTVTSVPSDEQIKMSNLKAESLDRSQTSALVYAIRSGHGGFLEIISLLVKNGCDLDYQDAKGKTALHYSSELGQDDTLDILLKNGVQVNLQDKEGRTALHDAIENGQFNAVQILCEQGKADVNIPDKNADTLLHYAAVGQGNASLYIKFLVQTHNMSVFVKNKNRLTPRQHAQRNDRFKFHRVIKLLRDLEEKESNINTILDEDDRKQEKDQKNAMKSWDDFLLENSQASVGIAILLGFFLFLMDKLIFAKNDGIQADL